MKITILGSCRQEAIESLYSTTSIKNNISYPHYTKEILSVIRFCLYGDVPPNETLFTFRSAIINKKPLYFTEELKNEFLNSDVYIIEIASRRSYKYKNRYTHHILYDDIKFNRQYKNEIICNVQSDSEIENDIIEMKNLLNKPIIIVGHITTYSKGSRFKLVKLLENICLRHNILFINPTEEVKQLGLNINNFVKQEKIIAHYNNKGKELMKSVYKKYITRAS